MSVVEVVAAAAMSRVLWKTKLEFRHFPPISLEVYTWWWTARESLQQDKVLELEEQRVSRNSLLNYTVSHLRSAQLLFNNVSRAYWLIAEAALVH
jgi:hypothetical protein